eukprot:2507722-Rhodomonas_salina.3
MDTRAGLIALRHAEPKGQRAACTLADSSVAKTKKPTSPLTHTLKSEGQTGCVGAVSYTHLRAHETEADL